jgi:class 3 adenylate cyclase
LQVNDRVFSFVHFGRRLNCLHFIITGFTAWSSEREPSQVFTLLENIYAVMDKLAKKNNVFKVETVGDCYVAATGLPDPQEQHAVIMVRFAQICLVKIRELVLALESQLGPGTADLAMRAGIHSGPVTAGVLRGQKARFQLFGDTMNTAARMESNGSPHKVHISSETYEYLKQSGKAHWAIPREELVHAKGKGSVQTYWIRSMSGGSSAASSSEDMNGPARRVSHLLSTTKPWEGTYLEQYFGLTEVSDALERLVNWNADLLASLLKSIVASRVAAGRPGSAPVISERKVTGDLVLDEIEMEIKVPDFDAVAAEEIDNVMSKVQLPEFVKNELHDFVACIASGYMQNSFHNFEHASHVILSSNKLLKRIMSLDNHKNNSTGEAITSHDLYEHTYGIGTDPLTQFAIVFSALIHDVGHVGVPNFVLAEENPDLAERYVQKSIAEQHSVTVAWDLLMQPHFRNLRSYIYTTEEECVRFRRLLVNMVMATDIFDPDLKALRASRWEMAFGEDGGTNSALNMARRATIVIEHVIQASDVSHTMQHWYIYKVSSQAHFKYIFHLRWHHCD